MEPLLREEKGISSQQEERIGTSSWKKVNSYGEKDIAKLSHKESTAR